MQDNYDRLKYACTLTDTQLTEVEGMLEKEQKCNKSLQEKIDQMLASNHKKDEIEAQLKKQLGQEQLLKKTADSKITALSSELQDCRSELEELQRKFSNQQQYVMEQTTNLYVTQEKVEVLQNENHNLQAINDNCERELVFLKEENSRILSDLFNAKEESQHSQQNLKDLYSQYGDLQNELQDLKRILEEKENFNLQREIKSEATLAQHKKLIDYLQLKIEDFTQKKKKTFADKIFGNHNLSSASRKENIGPAAVETSILYRTLQEELRREQLKSKSLQEQLKKLQQKESSVHTRSPLQSKGNQKDDQKENLVLESPKKQKKSDKPNLQPIDTVDNGNSGTAKYLQSHHRFELALQEVSDDSMLCLACNKPMLSGSAYWKCRECKNAAHRKCRKDVKSACADIGAILSAASGDQKTDTLKTADVEVSAPPEIDVDAESIGTFSYEGKLDDNDIAFCNDILTNANKFSTLVFPVPQSSCSTALEVACAYEIDENKILLLGCSTGLYALNIEKQSLVQIAGVDSISCISVSQSLAKVIMVGSNGESLYQCDLRHLQSRCQASASLKPALEASVLELPFANRISTEKWKLVQISEEAEQPLDTVAIGATSVRIIILKYDIKQQKFKPVRALDTATPVSSILFTRHTAIVSSDKFFEIDLVSYGAEEFVDVADQTLSHTQNCQPVVTIRISKNEFLLCFMECGIFVDVYGCRSRPYDLNWEHTPCGFIFRAPFLYVAHFQSVQIIRLYRSYSNELMNASAPRSQKDLDADVDDVSRDPQLKRSYLQFYMPTLLTESGKFNVFMMAIQKTTGLQEIYHLDARKTLKGQHNESLDTISSVATSVTLDNP